MSDKEQAGELPLGLSAALASDPDAMRYFSNLPAAAQERVITRIHSIGSKAELRDYVASLKDADSGRVETL